MKTSSFHDLEQLSAYLDGQLSQAEQARLEARIRADPGLTAVLDELRQTRELLRLTLHRRAPHNFLLNPKMAGIRPPVPRLVPVFSWASAVAILLFISTFAINFVGSISLGPSAPQVMAPGYGGGIGGGPEANTQPSINDMTITPTPEVSTLTIPQATLPAEARTMEPAPALAEPVTHPVNPWLFVWLGAAVILACVAFLIRWTRDRAFAKYVKR